MRRLLGADGNRMAGVFISVGGWAVLSGKGHWTWEPLYNPHGVEGSWQRTWEEEGLYEAITGTYLPLAQLFEGLRHDGVRARATVSLSAPLISMLTDDLLKMRYAARLAQRRGILTHDEAAALVIDARRVFYMDRTWDDVLDVTPLHARAAFGTIALLEADLKRLDARFALRSVVRRFFDHAVASKQGSF